MENFDNLDTLNINHSEYKTRLSTKFKNRKNYSIPDKGIVRSFIPGTIVEILVKEGQTVAKGEDLLVLDAMKMKNRILALSGGVIKKVSVKVGDRIPKGTILLELE
jgi:biotin carboxyl carrier protein